MTAPANWTPTQFELQTSHGTFTIMTGPSWGNCVQRCWTVDGAWRVAWVGGSVNGIPRRYSSMEAAVEAVGAEFARLDAGEVAVCTAGGEQLEACRKAEVAL